VPGQFWLYRVIDSEHVTGQGGRWASLARADDFTGKAVGVSDRDPLTVLRGRTLVKVRVELLRATGPAG
jgi:hypothetical protein